MTRHNGLTVPAGAVQQGQNGMYAYAIKPDNTVENRPITVAQISGGQALIDCGLAANEQVVVDGQYKLQPGSACHDPARQGGRGSRSAERAAGSPSHEHFRPVHRAPDRHRTADGGAVAGGLVAYPLLPVASLPNVNYPTLSVTAQLPGADPQTMASSVATPLEDAVRPDPRAHPDDLGERARLHPDHAAIRPQPRISTGPSPTRCRRSMPRPPICRPRMLVSADDPEGQSGRHADPGARR